MKPPTVSAESGLTAEQDAPADEHVLLIGRPPLGEYLLFVEESLEGKAGNRREFIERWGAANDYVRGLERDEPGYALSPPVGPVPDRLDDLGDQVLSDPLTRTAFGVVPVELGMVELDRLVVFQKHINIAYVRELRRLLGPSPTEEDVFRLALPFDRRHDPAVHADRVAPNVWRFTSPSQDFRLLEQFLMEPGQLPEFESSGVPVAILALLVGYGPNYLSVIRVDDRLVLNNGSHRAYALREAGHTHAPCLIQSVSRREELEVVGSAELHEHPERYLDLARPPVLRDYFDDALRLILHMPRRDVHVSVSFSVERSVTAGRLRDNEMWT